MAWKPNSPARVKAFDATFGKVHGSERMEHFGCPGYAVSGKVFAILQEDRFILRMDAEKAGQVVAEGGRLWAPMAARPPSKNYVIVPDAWTGEPAAFRPWIDTSMEFARTLAAEKKPKKKK